MFTSRYSTWFHQSPSCTLQDRLRRLSCAHIVIIGGCKNNTIVVTIIWWGQFWSWPSLGHQEYDVDQDSDADQDDDGDDDDEDEDEGPAGTLGRVPVTTCLEVVDVAAWSIIGLNKFVGIFFGGKATFWGKKTNLAIFLLGSKMFNCCFSDCCIPFIGSSSGDSKIGNNQVLSGFSQGSFYTV